MCPKRVKKPQWKWRDKSAIAVAAGITRQHFNEILQRRCRVSDRRMADRLAAAAFDKGYAIPWEDWMLNTETVNPYFAAKEV